MSGNYVKLAPAKFGFAWGVMWALGILLTALTAWLWGYGLEFVQALSTIYIGYSPTFLGGIIGAIWGFIDFFIFTWLVALIYNCCCSKCKKSVGESSV